MHAPNKSLTPITLVSALPSIKPRPSRSDLAPNLEGEARTDSECSVSLVRVSEGDGWVSELPHAPTGLSHQ